MPTAEPADRPLNFLASLRTARAAAIAGVLFAAVALVIYGLLRSTFPDNAYMSSGAPLSEQAIDRATLALDLLPYASIAFLWFMAALNYNLGHVDHRLFSIVFTGSGLIYVTISLVAGAFGSGVLEALREGSEVPDALRTIQGTAYNELLLNYGVRMSAVFVLALSTFGRVRKVMPGWLSWGGTAAGALLLLVPYGIHLVVFIFPIWVGVVSVYLFIAYPARHHREDLTGPGNA